MRFGKTIRDRTLKEWRFYTVDYKALKQSLKLPAGNNKNLDSAEFFRLLEESEMKLTKFYNDKERWAFDYMKTLEDRVTALRDAASSPDVLKSRTSETTGSSSRSSSSNSLSEADSSSDYEPVSPTSTSEPTVLDLEKTLAKLSATGNNEWLKEAYRQMGSSPHFHKYIYAKKSLMTFERELELLLDFLELNKTAFSKILKKFDKKTGSTIREERLAKIAETHAFLEGAVLRELKDEVESLIEEVNTMKPSLPKGWENRKVYTIGCFDLFHRG